MKRFIPAVVALSVIAGLFYAVKGSQLLESDVQNLEVPVIEERAAEQAQEPGVEKQFEDVLNAFLKETSENGRAYKKKRKILSGLIKPVNLRTPDYIVENYQMSQALLLSLQAQMDSLMLGFEEADQKIKNLLGEQPEDARMVILTRWEKVKKQQAGLYVGFFAIEQEQIQVYKNLMAFYHSRRAVLHVDLEENKVVFRRDEDTKQEAEMLRRLKDLSKEQALLLRKK